MATTTKALPAPAFDNAVADLKSGAEAATMAQRDAAATAMKAARDAAAFGKGSYEALVEASKIAAAGWQALAQDAAKSTQAAFEQFVRGTQALAGAKTARERLDIQVGFMRNTAETALAEATRFARAGIDLNARVAAPVLARAAIAADSFKI